MQPRARAAARAPRSSPRAPRDGRRGPAAGRPGPGVGQSESPGEVRRVGVGAPGVKPRTTRQQVARGRREPLTTAHWSPRAGAQHPELRQALVHQQPARRPVPDRGVRAKRSPGAEQKPPAARRLGHRRDTQSGARLVPPATPGWLPGCAARTGRPASRGRSPRCAAPAESAAASAGRGPAPPQRLPHPVRP